MKNRVGERWVTVEGYNIEITEYFNACNCTIKFDCGLIIKTVKYSQIITRNIKNPLHPSVFGIGYIGVGDYKTQIEGKRTKVHRTWVNMLMRCYDKIYQEKQPTYIGCTVAEEWLNFQNFAKWYSKNYREGFDLDKDILFKGNKIYSPKTCCFVPREINLIFTNSRKTRGEYPIGVSKGKEKFQANLRRDNKQVFLGYHNTPELAFQVYKTAKEDYIKELLEKFKEEIPIEVRKMMADYKVNIND